jgi:hypothetical protein
MDLVSVFYMWISFPATFFEWADSIPGMGGCGGRKKEIKENDIKV